jgi:hypothetical protein
LSQYFKLRKGDYTEKDSNLDSILVVYTDDMDTPHEQAEFLAKFTPIKSDLFMYYYYLEK